MRKLALLGLVFCVSAQAMPHSRKVRAAFQRSHPCPANHHKAGACPGWVVDHRIALCVGGLDEQQNMRWSTVAAAKAKDRWECKPGWEKKLAEEKP